MAYSSYKICSVLRDDYSKYLGNNKFFRSVSVSASANLITSKCRINNSTQEDKYQQLIMLISMISNTDDDSIA